MKKKKKQSKTKKKAPPKNVLPGKPLKFPELEKLQADIAAYFDWCNPHIEMVQMPVQHKNGTFSIEEIPQITKQRAYTVSGLAYFLDTTRRTLLDYEELAEKSQDQLPLNLRHKDPAILKEYSHTIKRAKMRVEGFIEERLLMGHAPVGSIFALKNNFGWKDTTEVLNTLELEAKKEVDELREKVTFRLLKGRVKSKGA